MTRPGRPRAGGEKRGNSYDRKRRRAWVLENFDADLGDELVRCHLKTDDGEPFAGEQCHGIMDADTLTIDRKDPAGTYERANIQPACAPCQSRQGALISYSRRLDWLRWREEADARGIEWDGSLA